MELTVIVHAERGRLWSEVEELRGCFATGRTLDELQEALAEAVGLYLWDLPAQLQGELRAEGPTTVEVVPAPRR